MGAWGAASFENDAASDWFNRLEEAVDPGAVIASALDDALGEPGHLDQDAACQAIAAAELSACCAGLPPGRLPDGVRRWVDSHPHQPHDAEIEHAVQALTRVRAESGLRDSWDETDGPASDSWDETDAGPESEWLREVDDLIGRLAQAGAGDPATLSP